MIIVADYREAQVAFDAGAYKAAALLAASVIEGLFLDVLRRPSIMQASNYAHATNRLRRGGDSINWDRVDLVSLADAAKELGLLHVSVDHLGRGVADFRDTIHPQNELTRGRRPQREEAAVLIHLIPLLSRDFEALS